MRRLGLLQLIVIGLAFTAMMPPGPALAQDQCGTPLDVDGNGAVEPLSDGLLVMRSMFGFTGGPLIAGAVDLANCTRCTAPVIEDHLEGIAFSLEIDDSGETNAVTDGVLILRSLFGLTGSPLVTGAVDLTHCERCSAVAIEVWIENLTAASASPLDVWAATTVPFDLDCVDCDEIDESDVLPHLGVQTTFLYDESIDDPIAQWADCLGSMLDCFQEDGSVSDCAAAAECPAECKALYSARAPAGADELTLLEVLNGVYVNCGAPCRPLPEALP